MADVHFDLGKGTPLAFSDTGTGQARGKGRSFLLLFFFSLGTCLPSLRLRRNTRIMEGTMKSPVDLSYRWEGRRKGKERQKAGAPTGGRWKASGRREVDCGEELGPFQLRHWSPNESSAGASTSLGKSNAWWSVGPGRGFLQRYATMTAATRRELWFTPSASCLP